MPDPQGCEAADNSEPGYCGFLRGTLPFKGINSSGFENNKSSTWHLIGSYDLAGVEEVVGYTGNGEYGYDTVSMSNANIPTSLTKQVVAGVPSLDYWLGSFCIAPQSINFTGYDNAIPSFVGTLFSSNRAAEPVLELHSWCILQEQASLQLRSSLVDTMRIASRQRISRSTCTRARRHLSKLLCRRS
jgi:hypothetical protein